MTGKEELKELKNIANSDLYEFENYCGSCDNFPYNEHPEEAIMLCPFRNIVTANTNWKSLGCKYFWN